MNVLDIRNFPNYMQTFFEQDNLYDYYIKNTIGDGSCLIHSLLQAIDEDYRNGNTNYKKSTAHAYRKNIAKLFTEEDFNLYKEYYGYSFENQPQYNNQVKRIIESPSSYLEIEFISFLSRINNINIFAFMQSEGVIIPYCLSGLTFKDDRKTIFIYYSPQNSHFESICRIQKNNMPSALGENNYMFSSDDPIVQEVSRSYIHNDYCLNVNGFSNWKTKNITPSCNRNDGFVNPDKFGYCKSDNPYVLEFSSNTKDAHYCCTNFETGLKLVNSGKITDTSKLISQQQLSSKKNPANLFSKPTTTTRRTNRKKTRSKTKKSVIYSSGSVLNDKNFENYQTLVSINKEYENIDGKISRLPVVEKNNIMKWTEHIKNVLQTPEESRHTKNIKKYISSNTLRYSTSKGMIKIHNLPINVLYSIPFSLNNNKYTVVALPSPDTSFENINIGYFREVNKKGVFVPFSDFINFLNVSLSL